MRSVTFMFSGHCTSRGRPASTSAHHFEDKYVGRSTAHGCQVEGDLTKRGRDILRSRPEAGRTVCYSKVIIHRFGNTDADDWGGQFRAKLADFMRSVLRAAATIVEEVADV